MGEEAEGGEFLEEVLEEVTYARVIILSKGFINSLLLPLHPMINLDTILPHPLQTPRIHPPLHSRIQCLNIRKLQLNRHSLEKHPPRPNNLLLIRKI